jgi:DNA-binding transcriptional ArsR family regulator
MNVVLLWVRIMGVRNTQEQAPADASGSHVRPGALAGPVSHTAGVDPLSHTAGVDPPSQTAGADPRSRTAGVAPLSHTTDRLSRAANDPLSHPAKSQMELAAVLHALSDPMRLRIVVGLAREDDRSCKSFQLPVTKSTCTHHFRVLREAGVIRQKLEGTTRLNSLRRQELDERFPGLLDSVLRAAQL